MNVTPDNFARQLDALISLNLPFLTAQNFLDFLQGRLTLTNGGVFLTFDDGFRGLVAHALPLLKEKQIPATIFVTTRFLNSEEPFPFFKNLVFSRRVDYPSSWLPLTTDHIKSHPHIVWGGHGASHDRLGRLSLATARQEIRECREMLTRVGIKPPFLFSYPQGIAEHGDWTPTTNQLLAAEGFALAFTSHLGRVKAGASPFALRRMPINSHDTPEILRRKISGAYDWLYWLQKFLHRLGL